MISLATYEPKKQFIEGVQTRFLIMKLEPFPKFKRNATMIQL
jgi:hypothetical protein